jgi:Zn-dependent protease
MLVTRTAEGDVGGWSIPMGRILGIPVRAHWTVLLLLPAAMTLLASGVFREWYPGWSVAAHAGMAAAAAVLLLLSILLHEMGHALAARRLGIRVDGVTLWALGGLTRFSGPAHRPRDEVRIAAAGPLATLGVAVVAGAAAPALAGVAAAQGVVAWLAAANLLLLVFNLLPGFPLDGGRILRGMLWARSGDHARATRTAAVAGRVIGASFGGLAAVLIVAGAAADGVWLGLIAWFLLGAAGTEEALAAAERALGDTPAAAVMRPVDGVVAPGDPIPPDREGDAPARVVVADGRLWGLLVAGDEAGRPAAARSRLRVHDVALPRGAFMELAPADLVGPALEGLVGQPRLAVVVDGDRPVGIVTLEDVDRRLRPAAAHHAPPRRRGARRPVRGPVR